MMAVVDQAAGTVRIEQGRADRAGRAAGDWRHGVEQMREPGEAGFQGGLHLFETGGGVAGENAHVGPAQEGDELRIDLFGCQRHQQGALPRGQQALHLTRIECAEVLG